MPPDRKYTFPEFFAPLDPCNAVINRCPVSRDQAERRIAIFRLAANGDILMASPLLKALREAYPNAHITWFIEHANLQSIVSNPFVDEVVVWDGQYWRALVPRKFNRDLTLSALFMVDWLPNYFRLKSLLRACKFDDFLCFQADEWMFVKHCVGARNTLGLFDMYQRTFNSKRSSYYRFFYHYRYTLDDLPAHHTDQYLLGLHAFGINPHDIACKKMVLGYTQADKEFAEGYLAANETTSSQSYVVIAPMTTWSSRNWSLDRWAEVADHLIDDGNRVILIGTSKPEDQKAVNYVSERMAGNAIVAVGTLTFAQLAALIDRAKMVVSSDTGPMHMAAALDTPYVALFGPTAPEWAAPLTGIGSVLFHKVPCGPCDKVRCPLPADEKQKCLRLITVQEVMDECVKVLDQEEHKHAKV